MQMQYDILKLNTESVPFSNRKYKGREKTSNERGVNQLYLTGGSRDMGNHGISSLQGPKIQKIVFLEDFRLSKGYTYFRPPVVNHILQSFLGVNQLSTTSGSRDMDFGQFWDFWA